MKNLNTELVYLNRLFSLEPQKLLDKMSLPPKKILDKVLAEVVYQLKYTGLSSINEESIVSWTSLIKEQYFSHPDGKDIQSFLFFPMRFASKLLKFSDETPVCCTEMLGYWHKITANLGEDLFTTALLAERTYNYHYKHIDFQWEKIIKSDFHSLNSMMKRKHLSENHMHLKGSSPYFDLNWLSLMNHPQNRREEFFKFSKSASLKPVSIVNFSDTNNIELYTLVRVAASLRLALFKLCCCEDCEKFHELSKIINVVLRNPSLISIYFSRFASEISVARLHSNYQEFGEKVDYAVNFALNTGKASSALTGERKIYYAAYLYLLNNGKYSQEVQNYFFLYLLISQRISNEFIQSNERYGFKNFEKYQNRKTAFIPTGSVYDKLMIKMAIVDNVNENKIDKLEVRFHGGNSPELLADAIKCIDNCSSKEHGRYIPGKRKQKQDFSHFYVLHFIKKPCTFCKQKIDQKTMIKWRFRCRHYELRKNVKTEAIALKSLREKSMITASRIFGIDAAASEVTCRPEVFAQGFRYLRNHRKINKISIMKRNNDDPIPNLKVTYHVGEDFYDLLDGLRAIDEAISFLQLGYGDRIGHGVALGIDINDYYEKRNHEIALPKQNLLDNIAWMLHQIKIWNIILSNTFYQKLKDLFNSLYRAIFNDSPDCLKCDLNEYIQAMSLRDENPEMFFPPFKDKDKTWQKFNSLKSHNWNNYSSSRTLEFYKNITQHVYDLNSNYHYNISVKSEGNKYMNFNIEAEYIESLKIIQKKMRHKIEISGIAIESNPSSNYLIGNLDDLSKLPLFQLFPIDEKEAGSNRLNVSVNTDDQGVFYTSLNKEYSLLSYVQKQKKNPDGSRKYSDDVILQWIERLIKNGNDQSFWKNT
ncbi:MAG: hypothetical protein K9M99_02570 [Candidatus Cloacimonetes bacterium]|nr:hypothetical protein [Candidatus Cloacimonadota bacterium]